MNNIRQPHKHAEIIKAWADGEEIEYLSPTTGKWNDATSPTWEIDYEYRIKTEPEYIPFDFSDAEMLIGKVIKHKDGDVICSIFSLTPKGLNNVRFESVLENYTFLDGSPCGKLKQS